MKRLTLALMLYSLLLCPAWAEDPVHFGDAKLKAAVETKLGIDNPTPSDMLGLTHLICCNSGVTSLTGLEYATNLESLSVMENDITNLSPLGPLDNLTSLNIQDNDISDISVLAGMSNLRSLMMEDTLVSNLSPLLCLTSLRYLDVRDCPFGEEVYQTQIPQISANNPGIEIKHDRAEVCLTLSSGPGGSIVSPGEGSFTYEGRSVVEITAKADPGFIFAGFSGTSTSQENPFFLTLQYDSNIRANFTSTSASLYVDDDAPGDSGPGNSAVSDPLEDGTPAHPFDRIQEGIEVAAKGATVFVRPGTYYETIDLLGKCIELTGFDPNDPNSSDWPVIDGAGKGPVVSITRGKDESCVLSGLLITGGKGRAAGAVRCVGSSPTVANCLIVGNRATEYNGASVACNDSNAVFINCTIVDNRGGQFGAALSSVDSYLMVVNSILWGNYPKQVMFEGGYVPAIRYSTVGGGGWLGPGTLDADPLFAALGRWVNPNNPATTVSANDPSATWLMGDYHLQSQAGRWDPLTSDWVNDPVTSPCIDGGDPTLPVGLEPLPNAQIINMGAYGGTTQTSKSFSGAVQP